MKKQPKIQEISKRIKECIDAGRYYDTSHATLRKSQRGITLTDTLFVLRHGHHEKKKDEYKPEYNDWTYAIRGQTIDGKDIRVAVAFDEDDMLIITVIAITRGPK